MTPLALNSVWCVLQVSLFAALAALLYLAASRLAARSAAGLLTASLALVLAITLLAASPWPDWRGAWQAWSAARAASSSNGAEGPAPSLAPPDTAAELYLRRFTAALRPGPGADRRGATGAALLRWTIALCLAFSLARFAWGVWSVGRLVRDSRPVADRRATTPMNELSRTLGVDRPVGLRESAAIATPATVGWRGEAVLLPATWRDWTDDELRAALAHELSHVAARDFRSWLLARLATAVHFYHPLVHWLAARLQLEQELAADRAAARQMSDPQAYLQCLASLALKTPSQRLAWPARTLFPSRSLLMRRVEMLRNAATSRSRPPMGGARTATVGLLALAALAVVGLRPPASALAQEGNPQAGAPVAEQGAQAEPPLDDLKQIGLAMLVYHDAYNKLPTAVMRKPESEHPYSWRVALLPFLEQQALYDQYRFDQPWDSPDNLKVAETVVPQYQSPFDDKSSTNTSYFVFTGPGTPFGGEEGLKLMDFVDGTSRTMAVVESRRAVPWTKPEDIPFTAAGPLPEIGGWTPGVVRCVFMDGFAQTLDLKVDPVVFRNSVTHADRTPVDIVPWRVPPDPQQ